MFSACGGGGGGGGGSSGGGAPSAPPATFTIGGTVSGLVGSVTLRNNGGNDLTLSSNGSFTFSTSLAANAAYAVVVSSQPTSPVQNCVVSSGSGTVGSANVTNISVTCATTAITLGGTVSGLAGSGLSLRINGGAPQSVTINGSYSFGASMAPGTPYFIEVATQPTGPSQVCTVDSAAGMSGSVNITNANVTCNSGVPRFVYVTNIGAASISAYGVNPATGALTAVAGSPFATGNLPSKLLVAPDGKHLYVREGGTGSISAFNIDQATGALTSVTGSPFVVTSSGSGIARTYLSRSGRYLAAVSRSTAPGGNDNIHLFAINPTTGALTQVPGSPLAAGVSNISSLVLDSYDRMVFAVGNTRAIAPSTTQEGRISAYRIDAATGAMSLVGAPLVLESGTTYCDGTAYDTADLHVASSSVYVLGLTGVTPSIKQVTVDPVSGSMTLAASVAQNSFLSCLPGVRVDRGGRTFLGSALLPGFSINATSGALSALTTTVSYTFAGSPQDVVHDVEPVGGFVYVPSSSTTYGLRGYRINAGTGSLDLIPGSPFYTTAATYQAVVDRSGRYLYVSQGNPAAVLAFSISSATGVLTPIGSVSAQASATSLATAGTQ